MRRRRTPSLPQPMTGHKNAEQNAAPDPGAIPTFLSLRPVCRRERRARRFDILADPKHSIRA